MKLWLLVIFVLSGIHASVHAQISELAGRLSMTNHILMIRHTRAPGVGDPPGFKLGDCKTQRNLSEEGIAQAIHIGKWLKQQGVTSADVYASPWCRTTDTARLLGYGPVTSESALASTFEEKNTEDLVVGDLPVFITETMKNKGSRALILVTHQVNIFAYAGVNTAAGEMILIKVDQNGKVRSRTTYPRPD